MELKSRVIGVMQPYFFANLGYYQLINSVDIYVILDHVSFMKRTWMTHNFLKNNVRINIPCKDASQNKSCMDVTVLADLDWFSKFSKTLEHLYSKEKNYKVILDEVLTPWYDSIRPHLNNREVSIAEFNFAGIYWVSRYLDMDKRFYASHGSTTRKKNEGIQDIVKEHHGTKYINAIGGQDLYDKQDFKNKGIDLYFIKNNSSLPNTSILDILFTYPKDQIKNELNNYELI